MNEQNVLTGFSLHGIIEAFLAGTSDGFLVISKDYTVITYNKPAAHFFKTHYGITLEEEDNFNAYVGGNLKDLQRYLLRGLAGEVVKFSVKFPPIQNKIAWFDFEFNPLKDKKGNIIGAAIGVFNTTTKNEATEHLKQSEELFKTLVQNSTDAFQLANDKLNFLYVSDAIKNVIGYTADEWVGKNLFDFLHPDDKELTLDWLHWLLNNARKVSPLECRVKNKSGNWTFIEAYGRNMLGVNNVNSIVINFRNVQAKKVADFALVQAEQRMSLLLNNTKESFIILNSRLRVVAYNNAAQDHSPFFFTQELQSGLSVLDLVTNDKVELLIELFEEVFDGKEKQWETNFEDADCITHVYDHVFRPLTNNDNDIIGVFITSADITQRKLAEVKVKESEERFKTLIQESFDTVLIKNEENIIIDCMATVHALLGYTVDELIGAYCFDYIHEDYKEAATNKLNEIKQAPNNEGSIDVPMMHKNGGYVWVEMKGKNMFHNSHINGLLIILRDIEERKEAEAIISLSEQRFKGLVQSGADMISIIDEEGTVMYSSPTVITILGNDPVKDLGKNVFSYIHPEDKKFVTDSFAKMLHDGTRQLHFGPYRFPNSKREYRWLETVVTNLSDDPAVRGIVINSRDVTDRIKLNEDQQVLTEELMKNNKDLQQFSYITSHNLRAPVANLLSLLSLYDKANPLEPFNETLIEKFEESTRQLNETLNDLLNVLVIKSNTAPEKERIQFADVILQVKRNVNSLLENKKGNLKIDFSEAQDVEFNKVHLESIFLNLISNAIKYSAEDKPPLIEISSQKTNDWTIIKFKDNGIGIDLERYKDRMFGLYQRFHSGKEGKGLGLYMIKSQIEAMGGKIEVESVPGKGSIFTVYFKQQ